MNTKEEKKRRTEKLGIGIRIVKKGQIPSVSNSSLKKQKKIFLSFYI